MICGRGNGAVSPGWFITAWLEYIVTGGLSDNNINKSPFENYVWWSRNFTEIMQDRNTEFSPHTERLFSENAPYQPSNKCHRYSDEECYTHCVHQDFTICLFPGYAIE